MAIVLGYSLSSPTSAGQNPSHSSVKLALISAGLEAK